MNSTWQDLNRTASKVSKRYIASRKFKSVKNHLDIFNISTFYRNEKYVYVSMYSLMNFHFKKSILLANNIE